MKELVNNKVARVTQSILEMAGVYSVPTPNTRPVGVSKSGANVFVNDSLAKSDNKDAGALITHALAAFIAPFNVLTKKEKEGMDKVIKICTDQKLVSKLNTLNEERKEEEFVSTFKSAVGTTVSDSLANFVSTKLYDHWGVISPAQKSMAIAAMAIQIHKTDEGGAICDLKIVSGEGMSFTVKDALDMLQQGKNPYPLVQNWDQIYRLVRVFNDKPTNEGMQDFAASHNLLGKGVNDAAVVGPTKKGIEKSGSRPAPQYGVGALATPKGSTAPDGYTDVANTPNGNVIVPEANGNTAVGAVQGSLMGTKGGADGISADAKGVYAKWKKTDAKAKDKGSEGGSALVAGLNKLRDVNPYLYSAMLAFLARFTSGSIDSTNSSQYIASLVGIALARIVSGKSEDSADREGVAIAQQVHNSSPAEFAKLQISMRALYANFGVSSKADAYQLSNQAYSEGRINDSDLVAMHQIYDVVYDENAFGYITKLLQGKDKGLEIAKLNLNFVNKTDKTAEIQESVLTPNSDVRARNRARYQTPEQAPIEEGAQAPAPQPMEQPSAV